MKINFYLKVIYQAFPSAYPTGIALQNKDKNCSCCSLFCYPWASPLLSWGCCYFFCRLSWPCNLKTINILWPLFGERINLFLEIDPSNELSTYVRVSEVQIQKDTVMRDTDTFATLTHWALTGSASHSGICEICLLAGDCPSYPLPEVPKSPLMRFAHWFHPLLLRIVIQNIKTLFNSFLGL